MSTLINNTCRKLNFLRITNKLKSFNRNYPAPRKRFYKNVLVTESDGKYEINLDKRKLKTPLGKLFQLPNEALATIVATEWQTQEETLQQESMHFTSLCNTALDNPCHESKESIVNSILEFLAADTLCYRSHEPQEFVILQKNKWNPLLNWFEERYEVKIDTCEDITGIPVSKDATSKLKNYLLSFNNWSLLGLNYAAENLKSLILTLAVFHQRLDVETAVSLSRLETNFQIEHWGKVEWSHDVEKEQITSRVAAAFLFTYLNESSSRVVQKSLKQVEQ